MNDHLVQRHTRRPRRSVTPALALALVAGVLLCQNAWAHGPHHHGGVRVGVGVAIGAPLLWYGAGPRWYGAPYSYYPYYYGQPMLLVPEAPVYVEQGAPTATNLWYFCSNPKGYYPYVKQCMTAWRTVVPQPPVSR